MLQNTSRLLVFAVTILALVGLGGAARSEVTSTNQVVASNAASPDTMIVDGALHERPSLSSRARRSEVAAVETAAPAESTPAAAPTAEPEAEPSEPPVAQAAPVRIVPVAPAPPPPATCPANQFCYPRVGIAGPIVPYADCSGSTDVGTAIRSIVCVSPNYLAAHAYTQFGRIAGWRAGDVVFAYGARYIVFSAFTQGGCVPPAHALAPLSLQTSLTSATCGPILVVQARPG